MKRNLGFAAIFLFSILSGTVQADLSGFNPPGSSGGAGVAIASVAITAAIIAGGVIWFRRKGRKDENDGD